MTTSFATGFVVRDAVAADHGVLVAFNQAMARETEDKVLDGAVLARGVRRVLDDARCGRYFVAAVDDGDVIGQTMITTEWSDWRDGHFYWIQSVYVRPDWRRRGVYRALHAHVVAVARAANDANDASADRVVGVRLYVEPHNLRAKTTYQNLGMSQTYNVMEQML